MTGVEIDPPLCRQLRSIFKGDPHLQIVEADILTADLKSLFQGVYLPVKVAGNIPYKITSPLIERLTQWFGWRQAVIMVQEEVADRITAVPGGKTYGVLSVGVQLVADTRLLFKLSKNSFRPAPQVDSAVIELVRRPVALATLERKRVMTMVRAAFSQRRKTIANALPSGLNLSKGQVQEALKTAGIDLGTRAETVDIEAYRRLSKALSLSDTNPG